MRKSDWFQRLLYVIMAVLGGYILYKSAGLLAKNTGIKDTLNTGTVQRSLEDAAMRTYAPAYTGSVENRDTGTWMAGWMRQIVPVYSYLAEGQAEGEDGNVSEEQTEIWTENEANPETGSDGEAEVMTETEAMPETEAVPVSSARISPGLREQLRDFNYLLTNYYTVDGGTTADEELLDADALLEEDLHIEQNSDIPQILIYHTHSQEAFADSEEGNVSDTIVGMGEVLAEELQKYGYNVIHDTGVYDLVNGVLDRSSAYDYARESVQQILEEYPSVEVIIDLHRDGVEGRKFVTEIEGRPTAMIMFFNGISRNSQDQPLYWLGNPYIRQNLAFSLQLQMKAREEYPGFTRNIYLKAERFNLHLRPRSLLVEAGTQMNTVEEERNAMIPLADLIHQVLSGT